MLAHFIAIILAVKIDDESISLLKGILNEALSSLESKLSNLQKGAIIKAIRPIIFLFLDLCLIFDHL